MRCDGAKHSILWMVCIHVCRLSHFSEQHKHSDQSMRMKTRITQVNLFMLGRLVGQTFAHSFDMFVCMQTWFNFRARPVHIRIH